MKKGCIHLLHNLYTRDWPMVLIQRLQQLCLDAKNSVFIRVLRLLHDPLDVGCRAPRVHLAPCPEPSSSILLGHQSATGPRRNMASCSTLWFSVSSAVASSWTAMPRRKKNALTGEACAPSCCWSFLIK